MLSNISRDIVNKEHPSFDENRKRVFCLGFLGGFNYSEKNPDANRETIDAVSRDGMNRSNPWYEEYEKETYLLGFNRGYSYVANDEARHYKQYMENPFSDQIGLGETTPDYDSADAAGLGVQFPILLKGTIIGWLPIDAIYDKDKPNHLISDDNRYLRMSSVGDSAEIKKEYRGQGYGKAAYYELAVKAARMGMTLCSAPDSSRSENANSLWKSLVSSGYARQNGDRYEFINSKLIVTNKTVGGGIQTAIKDMEKPSDRMVLRQRIADRLRELLPNIGDELFVNDGFDVTFNGLNHGFGDERGLAEKVYHSNLKDRFGDRFICGTTNGGIEIGEITTGDLQQLNYILDEKKYSFSKEAAHENALKPDSRFSEEMQEANANLRNVLDEARKDLGNTYKISPLDINMGNWTAHVDTIEYNPEFDLDYYVASGIDKDGGHSNIQIHKLDNISSICELTKAVHEAHVRHLEQAAKQAIHDRIVTPSARRFTSDQVESLKRYHEVAAPDKPAGEVFKELLHEVEQEPDVARKPEKWVTDTAKELDDLANGITREQDQGLKR